MKSTDEPGQLRAPDGRRPSAGRGSEVGAGNHVSLEGVHSSVGVPHHEAGFWQQWRAFVGPAILVSVGYMDPGNWGTDLQGGAQFKYGLLWVVALASLMAIFMQVISARLGVVTGKDLAQCCRDWYPRWTRWPNWLLSEVAIGACDLAEVLGSAVALNLLFHIPLFWAVIITGLRCSAAARPAALRHAHHRGRRAGAGRDHRRLLLHRDFHSSPDAAELPGDGTRPADAAFPPGRHGSTWPSESSGRRSCRTIFTCTQRWCRAARFQKDAPLHPAGSSIQHARFRWSLCRSRSA